MSRFLTALIFVAMIAPAHAADFLGKRSADWIKDLGDPKSEARRGAAFALGKCAAVEAVPVLVRALDDSNAGVRDAAAYALGEIVAERKLPGLWNTAGEPLRKRLADDEEARVRRSAACAIGQFGPEAASAREELEKALEHKHAAVRQNAAWALGRLKEKAGESGVKGLSERLRDDDATVRRDAAAALREIGLPTAAPAVRPLVDCLVHEETVGVRSVVVGSLVALVSSKDKDAAADLVKFLRSPDRSLSRSAALALCKIGGAEAKDAVALLIEMMGDEDASVRAEATSGLAHLAAAAREAAEKANPAVVGTPTADRLPTEAVTKLGEALSDREKEVRRNAALALTHVDRQSGPVIAPLVRVLLDKKETDKDIRQFASEAISNAGETVTRVVPELLTLLKEDQDQRVRQHIVMALRHVRDPKSNGTTDALEKVLDETGEEGRIVRYDTARVLAFLLQGKAPARAVTVLEAMLNDTRLREDRGNDPTLNKGDESSKSTTGARANLGGDARYMAANALGSIAQYKRADALEVLRAAAKSSDEGKKKAAEGAMKKFDLR